FALDAKSILDYQASNGGQKDTLGTDNIKIISSNLKSLSFTQNQDSLSINLDGNLTLETAIDPTSIFKAVAGLSRKKAIIAIENMPGIDSVDVSFNPAWKLKMPDDSSKVEITVKN
ncbi:MAG: hypothetical protein WCO18_02515, partial [bacterium]